MEPRHVSVRDGNLLLMIGTMKGAFLGRSDPKRKTWEFGGPYHPGQPIYSMAFDGREGRRRLWTAVESPHFGTVLSWSDDFGRGWTLPEAANVRFPDDAGMSLKRIWQIALGAEANSLYCGVEPAALFESKDAGETWSLSRPLFDHPHRPKWQPGGGGLCLHTVVPAMDGRSGMLVGISAGGVYRTDDGRSWRPSNQGISAYFLPNKYPEFGQCVHKIAPAAGHPQRRYLQNHFGLYRSDDGGETWNDIGKGVPSTFGFPIVSHPQDPDTAFIIPLESDQFRCTPEGKLRVYRTRNAGGSWQALTGGLPQRNALETVLRDAFTGDSLEPAGLYFGTRSGKVYGSANEGNSWKVLAEGLPPVVCVKVAAVGAPRSPKAPPKARGKKRLTARRSKNRRRKD